MTIVRRLLATCLSCLIASSCGGGDAAGPAEEITITTGGGTVTSPDGRVTLVVPAGALAQPAAITIRPASPSADPRLVPGTEYVFEPDGLRFAVPASLTIRYDSIPAALGERAPFVWLHRRAAAGWTAMDGQPVDAANRIIAGRIDGFSSFGGVVSDLAADLLTAGLQLQTLLTDAIATNAIALLGTIGSILQKQADPAFQGLAQPVLDAMVTTACNAYATAVGTARSAPVDDWGVMVELLEPVYSWAAVAAHAGAIDGCPNGPLTVDQIQTLKIQQFVAFYTSRLDPASFGQNFDRLIQEVELIVGVRGTLQLLGLGAADQQLASQAQHPLMDELRRAAYSACRSDGRHAYLGRLRNEVTAATFTDEQLLTDLQQCATRLTWTVTSADPSGNGSGTLGGGPQPDIVASQATTPGPAQGTITFGGDVRAFMCPDGSFAPDELVFTLGGVEVGRRSASGGAFFPSPLQLDAASVLQQAGIDPGAPAQVPLVAARVSQGCGQYVSLVGATPIATLLLAYPAPQIVYENDFSGAAGPEWSPQSVATAPSSERFLGDLVNGAALLMLTALPTHTKVTVELDLYLLRSWDGNSSEYGPDVVTVRVDGTPVLVTTFSNVHDSPEFDQAYPDAHPGGGHPPGTGASAVNSLGYSPEDDNHDGDSIYRLVFDLDHTATTLTVEVSAQGLEAYPNEFWGIDNVRIRVR